MIELSEADYQALIEHALAEYPNECCGLLAGRDGRVERVYRTTNADRSPVSYRAEPGELVNVLFEIDREGLDLIGIYHSHPDNPAYPSETDIRLAFYPESSYVIVSLAEPAAPVVRAFRIWRCRGELGRQVRGRVQEEELTIR